TKTYLALAPSKHKIAPIRRKRELAGLAEGILEAADFRAGLQIPKANYLVGFTEDGLSAVRAQGREANHARKLNRTYFRSRIRVPQRSAHGAIAFQKRPRAISRKAIKVYGCLV